MSTKAVDKLHKKVILFFGSEDCDNCDIAAKTIEHFGEQDNFMLLYIDAIADENQALCDLMDVDELPHIVLLDVSGEAIGLESLPALLDDLNAASG